MYIYTLNVEILKEYYNTSDFCDISKKIVKNLMLEESKRYYLLCEFINNFNCFEIIKKDILIYYNEDEVRFILKNINFDFFIDDYLIYKISDYYFNTDYFLNSLNLYMKNYFMENDIEENILKKFYLTFSKTFLSFKKIIKYILISSHVQKNLKIFFT